MRTSICSSAFVGGSLEQYIMAAENEGASIINVNHGHSRRDGCGLPRRRKRFLLCGPPSCSSPANASSLRGAACKRCRPKTVVSLSARCTAMVCQPIWSGNWALMLQSSSPGPVPGDVWLVT